MKIVRFKLKPHTTWISAWQADTLTGMLACLYARAKGAERLRADLLDPWAAGQPPFVLSDGFPGDLLPAPACLTMLAPPNADKKKLKRFEWLTPEQFQKVQRGAMPNLADSPPTPTRPSLRMRNTLDRTIDSVGDDGKLYSVLLTSLVEPLDWFSVYARVEENRVDWLRDIFELLCSHGYGADAAIGQGQVDLVGVDREVSWLEEPSLADGWTSLSTFQPGPADPVIGYWRSFVKYGRLGPDLDVDGVFKRPQWMLRSGAVFKTGTPPREWYGRLISDADLLPASTLEQLRGSEVHPCQPAFALAIPMQWLPVYDFAPVQGRTGQ